MNVTSLRNGHSALTFPRTGKNLEWGCWATLLVLCNATLLQGRVAESFVFLPQAVLAGQWYQVLLAPFTHLSFYHLVFDAVAFLLLWQGLEEKNALVRWSYFVACWLGSLLLPLLLSADIFRHGLCGLSGIAHGLFAITACEMLSSRTFDRRLGWLLLAGLLLKCGGEIILGGCVLQAFHFGDVGVPNVFAHLGGTVGGLAAFGVVQMVRRTRQRGVHGVRR